MGNYSIKKTGGFQLGHGYTVSPVFSDDGCIFAVQAANKRKATIWDVNLKKQIQYCNFSFIAFNLSISANGNRIASRSDGVLEVMDTTTGHCIRSIKKNNLAEGDELQINTKGNLLFDVSNGLKAGFMIWDIETGMCIYQVPFDGCKYMCTAVTRSYHDDVLISIMAKADKAVKGKTDWLWLYADGELRCLELRLNDSIASISIDGKYIFAAGIDQDKNTIFCILDRNGKLLTQVQMKNERTFPVRIPKWTPTGNKIVWTKDSLDHEVLLLDRHTLSILDAIKWPDISIAFSSTGWVAIAGKKGIALPQEAFNEAVKELGCMSVELEKQRFETYKQSVSERKELLHKSLNLRENTD